MKQFVFLYPIPEIIDFEIERGAYGFIDDKTGSKLLEKLKEAKSEQEKEMIGREILQLSKRVFRKLYRKQLNVCINERYRKNGFGINYAVFDGSPVSDVIDFQESDRIIEVGLDLATHRTKQSNGKYPYPDPDYILNRLGDFQILRIAGFHMWDCVERLAKRAYERGFDTLVDEDLTEFFGRRFRDPDFKTDQYPTYNPRKSPQSIFEMFMKARKEKHWLWQNY